MGGMEGFIIIGEKEWRALSQYVRINGRDGWPYPNR